MRESEQRGLSSTAVIMTSENWAQYKLTKTGYQTSKLPRYQCQGHPCMYFIRLKKNMNCLRIFIGDNARIVSSYYIDKL